MNFLPNKILTGIVAIIALSLMTGWAEEETVYERPVPEGGGPTEVFCTMGILDVDEISDADQNFTVNLFARVKWHDARLVHEGPGNLKRSLSEIWHPSLIFLNRQMIRSSASTVAEVSPGGMVSFKKQFWGNFSQPMNLHDFPFDQQSFGVQLVATGAEVGKDVVLLGDPDVPSFVTDSYSVADWKIIGNEVDTNPHVIPGVGEFASYKLVFTAKRLSYHHVIKIVAPLLLIVFLSQLVFWLSPSDGGSQLGVAVTSFLTVIAYHVALSSKLPEIAYLTKMDVFVFWGTILVFLAMIEVVITTGLAQRGKERIAVRLDWICRLVFPGLTIAGAFYAFVWH